MADFNSAASHFEHSVLVNAATLARAVRVMSADLQRASSAEKCTSQRHPISVICFIVLFPECGVFSNRPQGEKG